MKKIIFFVLIILILAFPFDASSLNQNSTLNNNGIDIYQVSNPLNKDIHVNITFSNINLDMALLDNANSDIISYAISSPFSPLSDQNPHLVAISASKTNQFENINYFNSNFTNLYLVIYSMALLTGNSISNFQYYLNTNLTLKKLSLVNDPYTYSKSGILKQNGNTVLDSNEYEVYNYSIIKGNKLDVFVGVNNPTGSGQLIVMLLQNNKPQDILNAINAIGSYTQSSSQFGLPFPKGIYQFSLATFNSSLNYPAFFSYYNKNENISAYLVICSYYQKNPSSINYSLKSNLIPTKINTNSPYDITPTLLIIIFLIIIAISAFLVRDSYKRRRRYENKQFYIAPLEQKFQQPFNTKIYQESIDTQNQTNNLQTQNQFSDAYRTPDIEFRKNQDNTTNNNIQNNKDGNANTLDNPPINFCPKCGNKLHIGVYYCSACGYKIR